ncbi:hypothetical protein SUGI_1320810 [Cryptomeria japonica]|uniref:Uncharacterized protein n=1 Tax=Cryptomeria japonica TaxID=3369 RepID=A0AAD3NRD5_CRYJA|nr:hypothetical protein SUGI_1320810 [Cryptomeria japonica]
MSGSQLVGVCAWGRVPSGRDYASGATRDQEWISWLGKSCTGSALVVRVERSRQGVSRSNGGKPVRGQVTKEVKGKSTEGAGRSVDSASVRQSGTMDGTPRAQGVPWTVHQSDKVVQQIEADKIECVGCNARWVSSGKRT